MKEFFKMFFASLLAMVVAGFIVIGLIIAGIAGLTKSIDEKEADKKNGNVLVIDLGKRIHEQGAINSLAMFNEDGAAYEGGLYDLTKAIVRAKTDGNIKGILLKLSPSPNGWATLQQLRSALMDFKTSKKFIYAYGEHITQSAYYVASAADSVYLNPAGHIELKGFATVLAFFKGTLEKLELEPEIFYAGKFKSATEPFRADKMSEPNRIQIQAFQKGIWNQFLEAAAQYTHADKDTIHQWAVNGVVQFPADALKCKMIAGLLYWDEVEQRLRVRTGQKESDEIKYVAINDYTKNNRVADRAARADGKLKDQKIAILIAEGNIVDGEQTDDNEIASKTFCDEIRKVRNDDKIKAVVLRVNSPGGSAMASEVILRELTLLKQKKHLIVSMGDYAASGGYYISSQADSIFAMPNTITGSIGVFSMLFSMDKLMKNKLGVTFDEVKNAPFADEPTISRPLTPQEAKRMQNSVDTIYALFKNHVAQGRRLTASDVDTISQGRVWTGSDAMDIGLVDGMGGLSRAIASAASMANIKDYKVVTYPAAEDKLTRLLRRISSRTNANESIKAAMKQELGEGYEWYEKIQDLRKMNGKAMMMMPFVPRVN
ncbi:MAG: signal peptide peptidase SppA [Chitinophagales bacterium]